MQLVILCVLYVTSNHFQVSSTSKNNDTATALSLWKSFVKFSKDVVSFFKIKTNKLEHRRLRVKQAFHKFVKEAFGADNGTGTARLSPKMRGEETLPQRFTQTILDDRNILIAQEYKSELHTVVTSDGYLLTLHRMLPVTEHVNNKLVLLHHGILGSSLDWLLLGPDNCLPCMLAKSGYDVWLANARGNRYSKNHINMTTSMREFWDFSWHEMGVYDLPAIIRYVKEYSNCVVEMHFIGYSMGATALLVLLSVMPGYNETFRSAILLAPLVFMYNARGILRVLADAYKRNDLKSLNFFEKDEFMSFGAFPRQVIEKFCEGNERSCSNPLLLLTNDGREISDMNYMENILNHVPAGGSTKTIMHYGQLVSSGFFQMYDYGIKNNLETYGDYNPPMYNLKNVTVPVAIFSSRDDWLSTSQDIITLVRHLPNVVAHQIIRRYGFGHTDFVWALDAPKLIFYQMFEIYKQFKIKK